MRRRKLLGAVGLGAAGMAGLLGGGRANGAGQDTETGTTTTTTGTATTTVGGDGTGTGINSDAERPFARISVGTREGVQNPENNQAHLVRVWNDSEETRTIGLALTRTGGGGGDGGGGGEAGDGDSERPLLDREVEFPADGYLTLHLLEPASYRLGVRLGGGTPAEIQIPRARFDCNDSRTDVTVTAQGQVQPTTIATEEGCPPQVTDRTFTAFAGSCGSENRASVSFGDESVTVQGAIQVPNPCYGARLADVAVTDGDTLRLTVTPTEPTAAFCAQCIAHVRYRAELAFRDRVPGTVEVVYRRDGETETVTRATRGAGGTTTGAGDTTTGQQTTATGTTETA